MVAVDVDQAYKNGKEVVSDLNVLRSNSDSEFKKQFAELEKLCMEISSWFSGCQVYHSNPPL